MFVSPRGWPFGHSQGSCEALVIFIGDLWRWLIWQINWYIEYRIINRVEPVMLPGKGWHYRFTNRFTGKVRYDYFPMLALSQVGVSFSPEQQERIKAIRRG